MSEEDDASRSLDRIRQAAVERMSRARGDESAIKTAITAYLRDGLTAPDAYHSPAALTDYFCVDTPSILDDAGYTEAEGDRATELFDEIIPDLVRQFHT